MVFNLLRNVFLACSIENITNWFAPVSESIVDTHRGIISTRKTSNIQGLSANLIYVNKM